MYVNQRFNHFSVYENQRFSHFSVYVNQRFNHFSVYVNQRKNHFSVYVILWFDLRTRNEPILRFKIFVRTKTF